MGKLPSHASAAAEVSKMRLSSCGQAHSVFSLRSARDDTPMHSPPPPRGEAGEPYENLVLKITGGNYEVFQIRNPAFVQ
jgi:hypothetical protein